MENSRLAIGSAKRLSQASDDSIITIEETLRTIKSIYSTFDELKSSWKGDKSDFYKKTLEDVKQPLLKMCLVAENQNTNLTNVGKIISDYHRK